MPQLYQQKLDKLLTDPVSFEQTPGFQFARDQGLQAGERRLAKMGMRDSGNAIAEMMKLGTGMAAQEYGNQVDRLGRLTGQEQQFALGSFNAANNYDLGKASNANTAARNWWDQDQGYEAQAMQGAKAQNDWNLQGEQLDQGWMNADTNRGNALANMMKRR